MKSLLVIFVVGVAAVDCAIMEHLRFKRGSSSASASASSSSSGGFSSGNAFASSNANDYSVGGFGGGIGGGCPGFGCGGGYVPEPNYGYYDQSSDFLARMFQQFAASFPYQPQPYFPHSNYGYGNDGYSNLLGRLGNGGGSQHSVSSSSSFGPGNAGITFSETNTNGVKSSITTVQDSAGVRSYSSGPGGVKSNISPTGRLGGGSQGVYSSVGSYSNPDGSVTVQKASGSLG